MDPYFTKCMTLLHQSKYLRKGDSVPLQHILEEAIFEKTGVVKDYTDFFQSQLPRRKNEETIVSSDICNNEGGNSDNDLELDRFKDDLNCVVCHKMDIGSRNRLLECDNCHIRYHQECHNPLIGQEDITDTWTCSNCRCIGIKKMKMSGEDHKSSETSSSKSDSHRHGSSSSSHQSSRSDRKKSSSSKSSRSSSKHNSEKREHC